VRKPTPGENRLHSWLLLGLLVSVSPSRRREFLGKFGTLEAAARAPLDSWRKAGLLRPEGVRGIFGPARTGRSPEVEAALDDTGAWLNRQTGRARELAASFVCLDDPGYPELLRNSPAPPAVLHVRGDSRRLSRTAVAVVGARRATAYGLETARRLGGELARQGVTVVSGGARGIDREAHLGALEAGGATIAVMGAGLDVPYPPENRRLFDRMTERGAVISEFPFGTSPQPYHFPIRNRVIAGLAAGVVVVEGTEGSGSLITAARALDAGRDVMAVPGPVGAPSSAGPNALLREGAALVRGADDVIEALPLWALDAIEAPGAEETMHEDMAPDAGGAEAELLTALDATAGRTADDLSRRLGMPAGDLLGVLMELELKGRVRQLPGGLFVRRG